VSVGATAFGFLPSCSMTKPARTSTIGPPSTRLSLLRTHPFGRRVRPTVHPGNVIRFSL
jgi:hypothetical protein